MHPPIASHQETLDDHIKKNIKPPVKDENVMVPSQCYMVHGPEVPNKRCPVGPLLEAERCREAERHR